MSKANIITVDASGKCLGRLASQVAVVLRGKDKPTFTRNVEPQIKVRVENTSKMHIDPRKPRAKYYLRHTGYPGGQKKETMAEVITKKGHSEVLRRAIYGMLPKNKLRDRIMKNIIITE